MKVAVSGKGGVGKSTVAGILAHYFVRAGFHVLAVDADPDANLASALGIPRAQAEKILPLSHQRQLVKERTGASPRQFGQLFKLNPRVDDIPEKYSLTFRGVKLLVMGGVRKGGEGCACPENVLLRSLLSEIVLRREEAVIVDMEAGIEHLGRATASAIQEMIIVVEPGSRSIDTALAVMKLSRDIGLQKFRIIGNKVQNDDQGRWVRSRFPASFFLGTVHDSGLIRDADRNEQPLIDVLDERLRTEFDTIFARLIGSRRPA
jgi:CO dehydrogenase maturation factor